jgi:hypothetical protein
MAHAQEQSHGLDSIARGDLAAQGVGMGGYQQAAGLEQARIGGLGDAQQLYGANMDNVYRQANNARDTYGNLAQQDFSSNIEANQQLILGKLAQQRAEQESQIATQRAQLKAQAIAAGVKV